MTPEEIVERLRQVSVVRWSVLTKAADLIEQQAKALEEAKKALFFAEEHFDGPVTIINNAIDAIRALKGG